MEGQLCARTVLGGGYRSEQATVGLSTMVQRGDVGGEGVGELGALGTLEWGQWTPPGL